MAEFVVQPVLKVGKNENNKTDCRTDIDYLILKIQIIKHLYLFDTQKTKLVNHI